MANLNPKYKHSRLFYSAEEERNIIRFIIDNNFAGEVGGNKLWKRMEDEDVCPNRTWQSMKNRFKKGILAELDRPDLQITPHELALLRGEWKHQITDAEAQLLKQSTLKKYLVKKTVIPLSKADSKWMKPGITSSEEEEEKKGSERGPNETAMTVKNMEKASLSTPPKSSRVPGPNETPSTIKITEKAPSPIQPGYSTVPPTPKVDEVKTEPQSQNTNIVIKKGKKQLPACPWLKSRGTPIVKVHKDSSDEEDLNDLERIKSIEQCLTISRLQEGRIRMNEIVKIGNGEETDNTERSHDDSKPVEKVNGAQQECSNIGSLQRKYINPAALKRKRISSSENEPPQTLRNRKVHFEDVPMISYNLDTDEEADTEKVNAAMPDSAIHTINMAKKMLGNQKDVEIKMVDPEELTFSQQKNCKRVAKDLKAKHLKINPFSIGAKNIRKLRDIDIIPVRPN